ncbi:MAG: hypothetical protein ACK55Z_20215, partial [bacterium]
FSSSPQKCVKGINFDSETTKPHWVVAGSFGSRSRPRWWRFDVPVVVQDFITMTPLSHDKARIWRDYQYPNSRQSPIIPLSTRTCVSRVLSLGSRTEMRRPTEVGRSSRGAARAPRTGAS